MGNKLPQPELLKKKTERDEKIAADIKVFRENRRAQNKLRRQ